MVEEILFEWTRGEPAPTIPSTARVMGRTWCWVDGRCDRLEALARDAGLDSGAGAETLLLSLWQARDSRMMAAIEGDFAFALFDGERLVLARDAFGSRPLHYARSSSGLRVSSGPLALAKASGDVRPDPVRLAAFALGLSEEGRASFFAGVEQVEAGHLSIFASPDAACHERWWTPRFDAWRGTQADAVALMDALLAQSIDAVLGTADRPALELSAGLDSNLLLGMASRAPRLVAISGGPAAPFDPIPGNLVDETELARQAATSLGVTFERVLAPPTGIMDAVRRFQWTERPINNPSNVGWMDAVHGAANERGADVLIQGSQGNFTTSWTGEYGLSQAIAQRDPANVLFELGALARQDWRRAGSALKDSLRDRMPGWVVRAAIERSFAEWAATRHVDPDHPALAPLREREASHRYLPSRWEHRAADPAERLRRWILSVDMGLFNRAIERRFGLTPRDPFANRALVEASLSMPARLFRDHGGDRAIARRLLDPRLPQAIREGGPPAVQGAGWRHALLAERDALVALVEWARGDRSMRGLFDLDAIAQRLASVPLQPVRRMTDYMAYRFDLAPSLTAIAFARWVEEQAT